MTLVASLLWSVATYFVVNNYKEKYKELELKPWLYAVGSFMFSFLLTMSWLAYRICNLTKNTTGKTISIIVFISTVIFNLFYIFG